MWTQDVGHSYNSKYGSMAEKVIPITTETALHSPLNCYFETLCWIVDVEYRCRLLLIN